MVGVLWKKYRLFIFIAVLVMLGVVVRGRSGSDEEVETATVTRRDLVEVVIASGEVRAERMATLNFPSSGKLWYMNVKIGDGVVKGQALAGVDPRALATAEQNAYFGYLAADANAKEVEDQVKGHDSDETFEQKNDRVAAQSARDKAYFTWRQAIVDKSNASLIAPFDGVVTSITAPNTGDTVGITDGITVVDPTSVYFWFEVDEADVNRVTEGAEVEIELDAYPEEVFAGKVDIVGYSATIGSTGATVFPVWASFSGVDVSRLRAGFNGDASVVIERKSNVLSLPISAIVDNKVMVMVGKERKELTVETGLEGEEFIEIISGLGEGQEVIVL